MFNYARMHNTKLIIIQLSHIYEPLYIICIITKYDIFFSHRNV